jgi:hypothetical protein
MPDSWRTLRLKLWSEEYSLRLETGFEAGVFSGKRMKPPPGNGHKMDTRLLGSSMSHKARQGKGMGKDKGQNKRPRFRVTVFPN